MAAVWLAGLSIVLATGLGSALGCRLDGVSRSAYGSITGMAAGVMLCAAVQGLLLPALEEMGSLGGCMGVAIGALLLHGMNGAVSKHLPADPKRVHGLLFVFAIGIHHFPEGLAAGVSFGLGETADTAAVCAAIALQNIPEAMMILPAMAEYGRGKGLLAVTVSGLVEILGLVVGYGAVLVTARLLPAMLALAAGAMLYVIFETMLPDAYADARRQTTSAVLVGYCGMLLLTDLLERLVQ